MVDSIILVGLALELLRHVPTPESLLAGRELGTQTHDLSVVVGLAVELLPQVLDLASSLAWLELICAASLAWLVELPAQVPDLSFAWARSGSCKRRSLHPRWLPGAAPAESQELGILVGPDWG